MSAEKTLINKINDDFYRITLPMPFRLRHVHVYALVCGGDIALFDTGFNTSDSFARLESALGSIGLGIKSIRQIYLTHVHADHCGMAGLIKEKSGATINLSRAGDESNQNYYNTDLLAHRMRKFYVRHGMTETEVENLIVLFGGLRHVISEFKGDYLLKHAEICQFGKWRFQAIFTPGHSNGHMCFFFPEGEFLISGDTVLPQITPNLSPDIVVEDFRPLHSFLASLDEVDKLPVANIYPGHGNPFGNLRERTAEMRLHHEQRAAIVLGSVNKKP
ncbi:MAG TPA: MBL fold metallo-hydrolase, partial [Smithellaceae bacterium]|nr:MBL fold metallo-hydrolase [Smithellaceae bacterium]